VDEIDSTLEHSNQGSDGDSIDFKKEGYYKTRISNLDNQVKKLKHTLRNSLKESEDTIVDLKKDLDMVTHKKNELEISLKSSLIDNSILTQKQEEIDNLQSIINQLEKDKEYEVEIRTYHLQNQIKDMNFEISKLKSDVNEYKKKEEDLRIVKEKLEERNREYDTLKANFSTLTTDHESLKNSFEKTRTKFDEMLSINQDVIEKNIIKQMMISYITKKNSKQILDIMTSVLNFTDEEKAAIGISEKQKWSWLSYFKPSKNNNQNDILEGKKLSDLWIEFLMNECKDDEEKMKTNDQT